MSNTSKLTFQKQDLPIWSGLDQFSELPAWLVAARDPENVHAYLAAIIPEFVNGQLVLNGCNIGHIRYKNDAWSGLYELVYRKPGETQDQVMTLQGTIFPINLLPPGKPRLVGAFGSENWQATLPDLHLVLRAQESENILAAMESLIDPEGSRRFLEAQIRGSSQAYRDFQIAACTPRVVRYKPGSRCTILYQIAYPPGASHDRPWPDLVVAKTYRGEKGQNAFDSMVALWKSPLGSSPVVQIAEPLAYSPAERVLIQGPVREERTLKDLIRRTLQTGSSLDMEELSASMRQTAAGLAELHRSNVRIGREWLWSDEVAEIQDRIDRLSTAVPSLTLSADALISRLDLIASETTADPLVPSHGSFRPAQVLLYHGNIGFIDFDSFCQSEPANDLGLFLSTVLSLFMTTSDFDDVNDSGVPMEAGTRRVRYEQALALQESFLSEYERALKVNRQRVALWEVLDVLMLVLHGWIKIKVGELADIMVLLERLLVTSQFVSER